ncbi:ASCH domain-containing protein [Comamonas testosteroni]|uniref:ASCH domain-containing protein n=1 Tax=Comamonas testosteroni TaxID=285 RepID=UPI0006A59070|nr:ASCH domain-containing protein [Comamonas testosteroni]
MKTLHLSLKREYFEAIRDGTKTEEYRLCTPYWQKRLYSPFGSYDQIMLTLGYPARDDQARRIVRPWRGFTIKTLTHPHFGSDPVEVYAINVEGDQA